MKFIKILIIVLFITISGGALTSLKVYAVCVPDLPPWSPSAYCDPNANWGYDENWQPLPPPAYIVDTCALVASGYTCTRTGSCGNILPAQIRYVCTKNTITYSATVNNPYTLTGTQATSVVTVTPVTIMSVFEKPSPFIYFHNAPEGTVSVSLSSALNTFFPKPLFNQKNGWKVKSQNGSLFVDSKKVDNLFYELGLRGVTMTRYGKNFSFKEEVITYLKDSDFLTKLGFNEEEKKNSLGYLIPKIQSSATKKNYYLSILDADSIAKTSTLTITPKPNRIDRQYFAVYPTDTPVKTVGTFVFPKHEKENGFTVKETGEFLIEPSMMVVFK